MRHWSPSCSHGEAKDLAEKHRGQREDLEGAPSNFCKNIFAFYYLGYAAPVKGNLGKFSYTSSTHP